MADELLWSHTDRHSDRLDLVVPSAGGFTVRATGRHGTRVAVWLGPDTARDLAAALTGVTAVGGSEPGCG